MALRLRPITFYTADPDSVHNAQPDGTAWADHAYKMFDAAGLETAVPALAVRTQVDVEPTQDFLELRGGWVDLPGDLTAGITNAWYLAVLGVPDVPAEYGGSIPFVSEMNLEAIQTPQIRVDAGAKIALVYDATYHKSKIRFTVKHPVGVSKRFQVVLECFR